MPTYAIGDIQGCFLTLQKLLEAIHFNEENDTLWLTGDLVNRGPRSLETLRFIKNLKNRQVILGNHDLHLLALAFGNHTSSSDDTLQAILEAPDREILIDWLRHQPLLHHDLGFLMVHAGLAPSWNLMIAKDLAAEIEKVLRENPYEFLQNLYGNLPNQWSDNLTGWDRLRCITNYFTRARFCTVEGQLELTQKGSLASTTLTPWFAIPNRQNADLKIIFGHWAALDGKTHTPNTYALDTGCVWGKKLTAMCLENEKRFSVSYCD